MGEGEGSCTVHIAYISVVYCFENKKDTLTVQRHELKEVLG